jgi:hypothetical protein
MRYNEEMAMTHGLTRGQVILRDLGDGLILRRATAADAEALAAFNGEVHREPDATGSDEAVATWTRDLMVREHPTFDAGDFTLIEDTHTGAIVSSLNLISQTWSYSGIEFGVGRPELVGTHPDYRRRGLVRAQFEVVHAWSAERGEKVQAVTGIPWYYRQFGYEMALSLGGGRIGYKANVPKLKEDEAEPCRVRPATEADLPFIAGVYDHATRRHRVACVRDAALWRYELNGRSPDSVNRTELCLVETAGGEPVGFLVYTTRFWGPKLGVVVYELKPGVSWLAVTPSVLRYMQTIGEECARRGGGEFESFMFGLGAEHPVYQAVPDRLPYVRKPYAWYIRVPDLPDFIRHVGPALEQRLAESVLAGHTGELKISFYRDGLRLAFEKGRLSGVEPWSPTSTDWGSAAFPDLTFLQLLFGYRSLEELDYAFADCGTESDEARALLNALFPKQASDVWPVA